MSRIGKIPVAIPSGVDVKQDGQDITVKGPKGQLALTLHPGVSATVEDSQVVLSIPEGQEKELSPFYGLDRALLHNNVVGVTEGYKKELEIVGTGYLAKLSGNKVELSIGFSHPVFVEIPSDLTVEIAKPTEISITGIDKQKVGHLAAVIRKVRKPEPYKGKGIRYKGEIVKIKPGKQLGAGG